MLKTFKKMILHTKDDDVDKPITRDYTPEHRDDYNIPEPEDIRRLPQPDFHEAPAPMERRNYREPYREPPLERPPMTSPFSEPRPVPRPSVEEQIRDIVYRLDNIERRLARLEGTYPQPRRY